MYNDTNERVWTRLVYGKILQENHRRLRITQILGSSPHMCTKLPLQWIPGPTFHAFVRPSVRALRCMRVAKNRGGDKSIATPDWDSFSVYFHMEMLAFVSWQ